MKRRALLTLALLSACEGPLIDVGIFEIEDDAGKSPPPTTTTPRADAAVDARMIEAEDVDDETEEDPGSQPSPNYDAGFFQPDAARARESFPYACNECGPEPWLCDIPQFRISCRACICCETQADCLPNLICFRQQDAPRQGPPTVGICVDPNHRGPPP